MSAAPIGTASQESASTSASERRLLAWRRRLERRRTLKEVTLEVPGAHGPFRITLPADPDAVLDELSSPEPHMPYWATLWPSGVALAEVALACRDRLHGQVVLELGCGLGTTATALVDAGATAIGADCFSEALAFARYNVARNTGRHLRTMLVDWRADAGARQLAHVHADVVVAADVLYEAEDIEPLLSLGETMLDRGTAFWLAEPGRATSTRFIQRGQERGWRGDVELIEREWPPVVGSATVRVHRFEPR